MISQRMCVACRQMKEKKQLIRVVRLSGLTFIDESYKAQGRGAYICREKDCIDRAQKIRAFERSLSIKADVGIYDSLKDLTQNAE